MGLFPKTVNVGAKRIMTINKLIEILDAKVYNLGEKKEIKSGYAGDFLSFVMSKAPTDCAWFTVMTNVNVCAVATLAEIAVIVLCDNMIPSELLEEKVKEQGVNLISTNSDVFNAIKIFSKYEN